MTLTADPDTDSEKRFLSRLEVAQLFEVSPHTVYRWTREGRLPYILTPGGRRRYPKQEIEQLVATWLQIHPTIQQSATKRSG